MSHEHEAFDRIEVNKLKEEFHGLKLENETAKLEAAEK